MLIWSLFLFCAALFILAITALTWVALRFGALVLSMEVGILKEFKSQHAAVQQVIQGPDGPVETGNKLKDFIKSRFSPSEGEFVAPNDEEQFIQEQVEHMRHQGLTDEELDSFIRQAVTDKE